MKRIAPPHLLQSFLLFLLSPRDRETVSGDLDEEFAEVKVAELGRLRASFWYARQVLSFVPRSTTALMVQGLALKLLCLFTALSGSWLGAMELRLRHAGYGGRLVIAATIVGEALLTLAALRFSRSNSLRGIAMVGCLSLLWLAGTALRATIGAAHLEGYVLLIALALIMQAVLTVFTLPRARAANG